MEAGIDDYQIWRHEEIVVCRLRARAGFRAAAGILNASDVQRRWTESLTHLFDSVALGNGEPLWLDEVFRYGVTLKAAI
jgi:L-rhamnose mutarotase